MRCRHAQRSTCNARNGASRFQKLLTRTMIRLPHPVAVCTTSRSCGTRCCAAQQLGPNKRPSPADAIITRSSETGNQPHADRRSVNGGLLALSVALAFPQQPALAAERGLARYIRKKRLDPLDTYVPVVLAAREQLLEAGAVMVEQPVTARDLLRKGAFDGLRESIRAVGSYAEINNTAGQATPLVNTFFRCLEDFDQLLAVTARESKPLVQADAQALLERTTVALDALLDTVPQDILERSRQVLEVSRAKERAAEEDLLAEQPKLGQEPTANASEGQQQPASPADGPRQEPAASLEPAQPPADDAVPIVDPTVAGKPESGAGGAESDSEAGAAAEAFVVGPNEV